MLLFEGDGPPFEAIEASLEITPAVKAESLSIPVFTERGLNYIYYARHILKIACSR